jgi:hypothetical protein
MRRARSVISVVTRGELEPYLATVEFPADRSEIVRAARRLGAPEPVRQALRALPPVAYSSKDEVLRSARTRPAPAARHRTSLEPRHLGVVHD